MSFKISSKGNHNKTRDFLHRLLRGDALKGLDSYGRLGVFALEAATPVDTGLTANSWDYRITQGGVWTGIEWFNTNQSADGTPIAIYIQYGHATRGGSYIAGYDYINPAIQPVFDKIVYDVWEKVKA